MYTERMYTETSSGRRLTGFALLAAGILLSAQALFMYLAQTPPSDVAGVQAWISSGKQSLMMANELLFFAAAAMAGALIGLYKLLAKNALVLATVGCSLLGIATVLQFVLCIIQGRLVYPVFSQVLTGENMVLMTSLFYGGLHTVYLLLAGVSLTLGAAMKYSGYGTHMIYAGAVSAVAAMATAYPWMITPTVMLLAQVVVSLWFVCMGKRVLTTRQGSYS